jgi:uncharacterized membrane protein
MYKTQYVLRNVLGVALLIAGANHFRDPAFYVSIMPPYLPWHLALVYISGVAEMAIGAMLFSRALQRIAAWGAIALFIAVFPANLQMALHPEMYPQFSEAALWLRLPVYALLIGWAFVLTPQMLPDVREVTESANTLVGENDAQKPRRGFHHRLDARSRRKGSA